MIYFMESLALVLLRILVGLCLFLCGVYVGQS